jgi:hypothetical protein
MSTGNCASKLWRRRDVIKLLGATAIAGPVILRGKTAKAASSKVIKIGHVSPQAGAFAPFAEADPFILNQIRTAMAKARGGNQDSDCGNRDKEWSVSKIPASSATK